MKTPCYKCTDRFYDAVEKRACHSNCEKYAEYHQNRQQRLEKNRERVRFNNYKYDNVPRLKRASTNQMFRSKKR